MFEKYDGIRAFWNPGNKTLYSRHGKPLVVPAHILHAMPDMFLDGELWFGRNSFQEAVKVAHRVDESSVDWGKLQYMVFDAPQVTGSYNERYSYLGKS